SKEANAQTEDELIRVMETLEVLAAQLTAAQEVLQTIESQAAETVAERRAQAAALRQEVEAEIGARDALASGMDPQLRSKYEMIFDRRGGNAVVAAVDC